MTARDALRCLSARLREPGLAGEHGFSRLRGEGVGPVVGPGHVEGPDDLPPSAPLDYAVEEALFSHREEEDLPLAARPLFTLAETVLLSSLAALGGMLVTAGLLLGGA